MAWSKPWYEEYRERGGTPLSADRLAYEIQNGRHVDNVLNWARAGLVIGIFVIGATVFAGTSKDSPIFNISGAMVLSASLLAAIALGGLLGFLFGIPKSGIGGKPENAASAASKPANRVNTNLEEVSDWLTKLILGAGLTQIGTLWAMFVEMSQRIGIRGFGSLTYGGVIAGGLIIYGLVVGFIAGYVLTRLYLSNIFLLADRFGDHKPIDERILENIDLPPPPARPSSAPTADDEAAKPASVGIAANVAAQVTAVPLEDIKDVDNLVKAARVHWTLGKPDNLHKALEAYRLALAREPARGDVRAEYAQRLIERKRYADAVDALTRALRDMRAASASKEMILETARSLTYAQLYLSKPESFERALATIEETAREPGFALDVDWRIKRLAANGQKLRHLGPTLNEKSRTELRETILTDVRDIVEKSPRYTRYLQGLIEPLNRPPGSVDDDLEALRGDNELRELVGLPPI